MSKRVKCKICGKVLKKITNTHLKTHNITKEEYKNLEGSAPTITIKADHKGYKLCKVCGSPYLRMSKTHLDEHGITREEYNDLPPYGLDENELQVIDSQGNPVNIDNVDSLIPQIRNYLLGLEDPNEHTDRVLNDLVKKREKEFKGLIASYIVDNIERLLSLMESRRNIENQLFNPDKVSQASTKELLDMESNISKQIYYFLERVDKFLETVSEENLPQNVFQVLNINREENIEEVPPSPADRDKLAKKFKKLRRLLQCDSEIVDAEVD